MVVTKKNMPGPGFEPGLLRPQRSVLTTRRSRLTTLRRLVGDEILLLLAGTNNGCAISYKERRNSFQ